MIKNKKQKENRDTKDVTETTIEITDRKERRGWNLIETPRVIHIHAIHRSHGFIMRTVFRMYMRVLYLARLIGTARYRAASY